MLPCLLLLLGQGSVFGAIISQKPRRDICQRGTSMTIQCEVDTQVTSMYWYRQLPGQSLILIATANQGMEATYESGFTKEKFPISRPKLTFSTLTVNDMSLEDSSSYLCSAKDTVPSTDRRSEQELQLAASSLLPPTEARGPRQGRVAGETTAPAVRVLSTVWV